MPSAIKEKFVEELTENLKKSEHVLITDYQSLSSEQAYELRKTLKGLGAQFKVVKNRLARICFKNVGWNLDETLKGPSAITFQGEDTVSITKTISEFSTKHKAIKIKGGFMFGKEADLNDINAIANLPSREVLLATLAATLNSPVQKLAATLIEPVRSMHAVLSAVAKKKESAPAA